MNKFLDEMRKNIYFPLMGFKELKELGDTYSEDRIKQSAIFVSIIADTCQNILFDKCSFEILGILRSSNIVVNQSSISLLGLGQSSKNHFKECTIAKGFNLNNQSNVFTDCVFNKKSHKTFQKDFNLPKVIKQLPYFIVAYAITIVCFFFIYSFNSISLGIDWIFLIGTLLCLIALYLLLTRNAKHKVIKKEK